MQQFLKPSSTGGLCGAKQILVCGDCLGMFYGFAKLKWDIYSLAEAFERVDELKLLYWESMALKDG